MAFIDSFNWTSGSTYHVVYGLLQFGIVLVYPIMSLYDGTRGKSTFMKWFFYWFYVGHLVLCGLIRVMM